MGIFSGVTNSLAHHSWHKQELFKGRGLGVGAGATDWSGWNIEEDWLGRAKISVEQALDMDDVDFKTNTVFYCYPASMNSTNISLLVRGAHLALGIPALTPAAGATGIVSSLGTARNYNLDSTDENANGVNRPNGWPLRENYPNRWLHSDMKDISFYYNFRFYRLIIEKGGLQ